MSGPIRVCSFESRKAAEMRSLIERNGAVATVAESMREIPLGITPEIREFLTQLQNGQLDVIVFLTGVGAEALALAVESEVSREQFFALLEKCRIIVRGPKPTVTLKKWGVRIDARAAEPNTWREIVPEILAQFESESELTGKRVAVQEYGSPSRELYDDLAARGAAVLAVPVYKWALPEDTTALEQAIRDTISGRFDVILITTAQQLVHTLQIAESIGVRDEWLAAARRCLVASIGPTASERLREFGLPVDFEPSHPHMGHLVRESLAAAPKLLPVCQSR
jgi:uroporphyrinogen-III synthase